jgi:hypothetical protein
MRTSPVAASGSSGDSLSVSDRPASSSSRIEACFDVMPISLSINRSSSFSPSMSVIGRRAGAVESASASFVKVDRTDFDDVETVVELSFRSLGASHGSRLHTKARSRQKGAVKEDDRRGVCLAFPTPRRLRFPCLGHRTRMVSSPNTPLSHVSATWGLPAAH